MGQGSRLVPYFSMKAIAALVLLPLVIFLVIPCHSMDLTHYDVESLVYLSTDIVIATLSENEQHQFTAVVTETLYGSIQPGTASRGSNLFLDSSVR
jgi:hypothetical protein